MRNLTKGNPLKVILLFAIPIYIGQQFQLLYSIVDTRIIGSVLGDESLAAVGATASLSGMCLLFLPEILSVLNISDDLRQESMAYIRIIVIGLIATTLYNVCAVILRAIGDSFTPLIFLMISNMMNIILDIAFVRYLHMGVAGAAIATVFSQAISACICFVYMRKKYKEMKLHKEDFVPDKEIYKRLMPTGFSMGFMISFVTLGLGIC